MNANIHAKYAIDGVPLSPCILLTRTVSVGDIEVHACLKKDNHSTDCCIVQLNLFTDLEIEEHTDLTHMKRTYIIAVFIYFVQVLGILS